MEKIDIGTRQLPVLIDQGHEIICSVRDKKDLVHLNV